MKGIEPALLLMQLSLWCYCYDGAIVLVAFFLTSERPACTEPVLQSIGLSGGRAGSICSTSLFKATRRLIYECICELKFVSIEPYIPQRSADLMFA